MRNDTERMPIRPISGGSLREAELPGVPGVGIAVPKARSSSPFVEGVRRLRKSTTAVIGDVEVAYQVPNLAPRIASVTITQAADPKAAAEKILSEMAAA